MNRGEVSHYFLLRHLAMTYFYFIFSNIAE
jgi:hypothetical protein